MRSIIIPFLAFLCAVAPAQIAVLNTATAAPTPIVGATDPAGALSVSFSNVQIGVGSALRTIALANASYIDTAMRINKGIATAGDSGWTIQFWYRPNMPMVFGYLFGDPDMVSPLGGASGGRFRLFQSGTGGPNGGLTLRGVPAECATAAVGALSATPLFTDVNGAGWLHIAYRYDPVALTIDNFINGALNLSVAQPSPMNWTTNGTRGLSILGDRGSSSQGPDGNVDDFRVYNFARCDQDIAADYNLDVSVPGTTPCGRPNRPDQGHFEFEASVDSHVGEIAINLDPVSSVRRRRFTNGSLLNWTANSPTLPGLSASAIINLIPGGGEPSCSTPGVLSSFRMCHALIPPFVPAIVFPDGLGIGNFLGFAVPVPFTYGSSPITIGAPALAGGPTGGFNGRPVTGDEIHIQWLSLPSGGYPNLLGVSNMTAFSKIDPTPGGHVSAEIRGAGAINVQGFFRIHNVGTKDISQVVLDGSTAGVEFLSTGALNTGGNLAGGTSYRFGSEVECSLANLTGGGNGVTLGGIPTTTGDATTLTFDFDNAGGPLVIVPSGMGDGFSAATDTFVFDCETVPANANGNAFIGATLTVTFTDTTSVTGVFVADPNDTLAAVIDL